MAHNLHVAKIKTVLETFISVRHLHSKERRLQPQCTHTGLSCMPWLLKVPCNLKRAHLQPNLARVGVPARAEHHNARSARPRLAVLLIVHRIQTILALLNPVPNSFPLVHARQAPRHDLQLLRAAQESVSPGHASADNHQPDRELLQDWKAGSYLVGLVDPYSLMPRNSMFSATCCRHSSSNLHADRCRTSQRGGLSCASETSKAEEPRLHCTMPTDVQVI